MEKTGWIKSKAAFRCLHASRLNEDQSRARSSKQDDWPRVGLGYGRGAHDKNGATRRRGWPLLFSHKCRVCDAPPQQTAPVYSPEKHRSPHSPLPHFFSCAILPRVSRTHPHPSMPLPFFVIGRHEFPGLTPGPGVIMRQSRDRWMAREWFQDCQRARRRQIERFSRVSWFLAWHSRRTLDCYGCVMTLDEWMRLILIHFDV